MASFILPPLDRIYSKCFDTATPWGLPRRQTITLSSILITKYELVICQVPPSQWTRPNRLHQPPFPPLPSLFLFPFPFPFFRPSTPSQSSSSASPSPRSSPQKGTGVRRGREMTRQYLNPYFDSLIHLILSFRVCDILFSATSSTAISLVHTRVLAQAV